jgi:hypothetical protein
MTAEATQKAAQRTTGTAAGLSKAKGSRLSLRSWRVRLMRRCPSTLWPEGPYLVKE